MNSIEQTLKEVIAAITKDVIECDRNEIKNAWHAYMKAWPTDIGRAMGHLQNTLLHNIVGQYGKGNESAIILGQYMKNLSWALQAKNVKSKDNFLKNPNNL